MSSGPVDLSDVPNPPSDENSLDPTPAPKQPSSNLKAALRDIVETLILTAVIFLTVQSVVKNFRVEGHSMDPTLQDGQFLLVNKAVYWSVDTGLVERVAPSLVSNSQGPRTFIFHPPQRGDIIVFKYPEDPTRDFVKRVIGLPGDVVTIQNGYVYVNGKPLDERYIEAPPRYTMAPERVPPGTYFVLGDNRNNSSDSHVWGVVPFNDIIGQAWISYWPSQDWGFISSSATAYEGK